VSAWSADPENWWTLKEAAHKAGMSRWALRRRIGSENGPPYRRRGRFYIFPKKEFTTWAAQTEIA
jgi:hypothetical protein